MGPFSPRSLQCKIQQRKTNGDSGEMGEWIKGSHMRLVLECPRLHKEHGLEGVEGETALQMWLEA